MTARFNLNLSSSAALIITMDSMVNGGARQSTAVTTTDKITDAIVQVKCKLVAGTVGGDNRIYVYAYASEDGSSFTSPATGVDGAVTIIDPTAVTCALLDILEIKDNTGAPTFIGKSMSIAQCFGWVLPRKWGIIVCNRTGLSFASSGSSASWSGVYETVK